MLPTLWVRHYRCRAEAVSTDGTRSLLSGNRSVDCTFNDPLTAQWRAAVAVAVASQGGTGPVRWTWTGSTTSEVAER